MGSLRKQNVNLIREIHDTKKSPMEISELKNTTIEIRNTLEKINGRSGDIGKCVHDLEDIIMGIAQSEPQKCIFKKMRLV